MAIYTCSDCGRPVRASAKDNDPIHIISQGRFCLECFDKLISKPAPATPKPPAEPKMTRGEAQRARWAKMAPEEKAVRTAHLRKAKEHEPITETTPTPPPPVEETPTPPVLEAPPPVPETSLQEQP